MEGFINVLQRPDYGTNFLLHIEMSVISVLIGLVISVAVAVAVYRSRAASTFAINVGNIGRAVPALAMLMFFFPVFGLGLDNAIFALTLIAIPPILINSVVGLRQVNPQVVDAAKGMGLSNRQILSGIQVPIAAPIMFAGIRTSAVQVVASATLATFIGAGGLGDYIVEGYQRNDTSIALAGALGVAVLAIFTEVLFGWLERVVTPKGLQIAQKLGRGK